MKGGNHKAETSDPDQELEGFAILQLLPAACTTSDHRPEARTHAYTHVVGRINAPGAFVDGHHRLVRKWWWRGSIGWRCGVRSRRRRTVPSPFPCLCGGWSCRMALWQDDEQPTSLQLPLLFLPFSRGLRGSQGQAVTYLQGQEETSRRVIVLLAAARYSALVIARLRLPLVVRFMNQTKPQKQPQIPNSPSVETYYATANCKCLPREK
ncbi:uncharacterized protein LOC125524980 [Triticum urartu]|uniref:Uncharacterized protein n=1 Tax=Triticum urartu TaxID=4572 RepID=A0A8R7R0Y1_TRIUA|nr:uncharacterized protein LOC125524975 [Triticum urartu]XP_048545962.1 uncharacterized protein LOC125524980 [Triticum urartu]